MRILALETDIEKIKCRFLRDSSEAEILTTRYHGLSLFFASVREIFMTILVFFIGVGAWYLNMPMGMVVTVLFVGWFFFVFFNLMKAWIDWCYDFIFVTTDRVILVDQTSVIRQKITPLHMENIASVTYETQFWDIFKFGIVDIRLKEGSGDEHRVLKYVPNSKEVATKISDVVTRYQRKPVDVPQQQQQQQPPQQQSQQQPQSQQEPAPTTPQL